MLLEDDMEDGEGTIETVADFDRRDMLDYVSRQSSVRVVRAERENFHFLSFTYFIFIHSLSLTLNSISSLSNSYRYHRNRLREQTESNSDESGHPLKTYKDKEDRAMMVRVGLMDFASVLMRAFYQVAEETTGRAEVLSTFMRRSETKITRYPQADALMPTHLRDSLHVTETNSRDVSTLSSVRPACLRSSCVIVWYLV